MFDAFSKRKAIEDMKARREAIVNGIYANSNYDSPKIKRDEIVKKIDDDYNNAFSAVYSDTPAQEEIDWESPFFKGMNRHWLARENPMQQIAEKHGMDSDDIEIDQMM